MKKTILTLCVMLLVPMQGQSADVYKWKDADGRIRYSDSPPGGKTPYEILSGKKAPAGRVPSADETAPAQQAATDKAGNSAADKELDAKKRKAEADSLQKKAQEKLDAARVREENCKTAKANAQNYQQGGRMYTVDENGERHFLDDKDLADGLDKANKEVDQWCDGQ